MKTLEQKQFEVLGELVRQSCKKELSAEDELHLEAQTVDADRDPGLDMVGDPVTEEL